MIFKESSSRLSSSSSSEKCINTFVVGGCADRNADVDLAKLRRCLLEIVELTSWDFLREGGDVHQERESKWEREYPPNKERDSE